MYVTIDLPPGIVRTGTEYKSRGRFYDANLWRWYSGTSGPIGGWSIHSITAVSGAARAMIAWRDNSTAVWCGIGTHTGLYVMAREGTVYDITPAGFTPGIPNAVTGGGYGYGDYGGGTYGTPRDGVFEVIDASVWSLDTWGQDLVGVMAGDNKLYEWMLNTATPAAAISGAPTASAVVVTSEKIMMALGADGDPRAIWNSDLKDNTTWTETVTNYARKAVLQTQGQIICGRKITGGTLIFTDVDVWLASFLGQPFVYGYTKAGSDCGIISRQGVCVTDVATFWMSRTSFWSYNGFTEPLSCDVQDYIFNDINTIQASKIFSMHNSSFGEVTFYYCSSTSDEINRYVTYNYRERHWTIGSLVRLAGIDRGVFLYPLMTTSDGYVLDHESGFDHGGVQPFIKSGPVELAEGEKLVTATKIWPDASNIGDVTVSFEGREYPASSPINYGPYALSDRSDCRVTARQISVTWIGSASERFQVGSFRFGITPRGGR